MPFGLYNASATFQRCMNAIFHDMCKDFMEVFMDDFSVFGNSFKYCLNNLSKILVRCEETNLVLNWEKCYFMVKEGIVLGHKISKAGIEVDKAKVDVIAKLPYPTNIKGIRSFLGHAGFYRRFIKDFLKFARPMTQLLMKDINFVFSNKCIESFDILRNKLTTAAIIIALNWNLDFELMCNASDYAEFTIEIKDKKGSKNLAADHLSRLENLELEELDEDAIRDTFPDKHLIVINIKEAETDPWTVNWNMNEWADKLDDALWAFRIAYKAPIGSTPFRIVYGKACHLPLEMGHKAYWALKKINLDLEAAGKHRLKGNFVFIRFVEVVMFVKGRYAVTFTQHSNPAQLSDCLSANVTIGYPPAPPPDKPPKKLLSE
ncbi:reverse transcriptase domain-containing protein [Tanacetum coccineum]